jgi:hypothetical protein
VETLDLINGLFELGATPFLFLHVRRVFLDKQVKGASIYATVFFVTWGFWNCLLFYPLFGLWWSFWGGVPVVAMNSLWLCGMWKYQERKEG